MVEPLQTVLIVASLVLAAAALLHIAWNRRPTVWLLGGLALLELALFLQCVVGIAQLVGADREVSALTFVGYLVGILLILPLGAAWALAEPTRSGTAVLVVATLVVPVLVLRLDQIWNANA
jgi:hypothetical protein